MARGATRVAIRSKKNLSRIATNQPTRAKTAVARFYQLVETATTVVGHCVYRLFEPPFPLRYVVAKHSDIVAGFCELRDDCHVYGAELARHLRRYLPNPCPLSTYHPSPLSR